MNSVGRAGPSNYINLHSCSEVASTTFTLVIDTSYIDHRLDSTFILATEAARISLFTVGGLAVLQTSHPD